MSLLKPELRDLLIFFIIALTSINLNIWSIVIPYYYSYAKHYNPSITIKTVFNAIICIYVGSNLSTIVFPTILFFLGLKGALLFGALVSAFNNVSIYLFTNTIWICICSSLVGFCYRHFTTVTILYFTEKYAESASKLYSIATSGFIITGFFWANIMTFYINPNNEDMTEVSYYNGYEERYFPFEVASRLQGIMNIQTVFGLSVVFVMSMFFENPEKYSSHIQILSRWLQGDKTEISRSIRRLSEGLSESTIIFHTSRGDSRDNSMLTNVLESNLADRTMTLGYETPLNLSYSTNVDKEHQKPAPQQALEELKTSKFWLLFYAGIFRLSLTCYYIDNCKILGYYIIRDDQLITQVFSALSFLAMIGAALAGNIVRHYGLYNCHIWSIVCNMFVEFISFTVLTRYPYLFLVLLGLTRVHFNFNLQLSNITLFTCYDVDVALQLAKFYDFHGLLANIVMVVINQWFYVDGIITYVFLAYFLLDGIALFVVFYGLKNKIN